MLPKKMLFILPLLLMLVAAGCMPQPTLRSELFLHDTSLITREPCAAPCWNNITPGETSWSAALEIIQGDTRFQGVEVNTDDQEGLIQAVWQPAGSGQFCCRMLAEGEGENVSFLFLALATPGIIVDQVLNTYGEPTYVTTFDFTDQESVVQLIYPDVPMVVSALVGTKESSLLANSEIVAMLTMAPDEMALILQTTDLKRWDGYQAYATYVQATPVVTPSVTLTPAPN